MNTNHPLDLQQTVGDIVARFPVTRKLLEQYRIDYCCGGKRTLDAACVARHRRGERARLAARTAERHHALHRGALPRAAA
jgi:iron-sulfur cluster repair protein YtfE (RIC family)